MSGIALVRADGRPAPLWRCAWRAMVFWSLPVTLILASVGADIWFWSVWREPAAALLPRCSWGFWWAGIGLLLLYAVPALWNPNRSLHDRLAGTYLVPR